MFWLESPLLKALPTIGHAFLTSDGGRSIEPFASLNCSPWVEDDPITVSKNLELIRDRFDLSSIHLTHQIHGTKILCADGSSSLSLGEGDGIFTREIERGLIVLHADCQPILVADRCGRAVMAIHAGWRGLMNGILKDGLAELERIGCERKNLVLAIGPSLGPLSAEFRHYQDEFPEWAWRFRKTGDRFDLWALAVEQAVEHGVPRTQIDVLGIDTRTDPRFFSYRRFPRTGRNGSLIWLRHS